MSNKRKVRSAFLQASGTNVIFGAETTLNPAKQPNAVLETDGTFLIVTDNRHPGVTVLVPLTNVKMMELV